MLSSFRSLFWLTEQTPPNAESSGSVNWVRTELYTIVSDTARRVSVGRPMTVSDGLDSISTELPMVVRKGATKSVMVREFSSTLPETDRYVARSLAYVSPSVHVPSTVLSHRTSPMKATGMTI